MTTFHNIDYFSINFEAVQGDGIDSTFQVKKWDATLQDWVAFDLTGKCIDMQIRRQDGLLIKDWHSCVSPAQIIINTSYLTLLDDDGIMDAGLHNYDIQYRDNTGSIVPHAFMRGYFWITKQVTV